MREQTIKENGAWDFYQQEISVMNELPDGKAYYDHVFSMEMDRSNPKNSYIAYVAGKVDTVDFTKPCAFTKEATALPDIDTDFPTDFREEVINYVKEKYGEDKVCQIITFGRLAGRSALKAVLRTCEICDAYTQNEITEAIPDEAAISDQLEEMDHPSILLWALENLKDIHDYAYLDDNGEIHGDYADAFRQAIELEGTFQNTGKHAAGVIISSEKIADIVPMSLSKDGIPIASLDMGDLEKVGLVKFDFLGVDILNKIYAVMGTSILGVPLDDPETWALIQSGNTKGFFQLEGKLGMDWSKELKPENIEQLAALTAIIRPGTLASKDSSNRSMTKVYCDRKNGVEKVPDGIINTVIDTYGVLIYQETLLKICKELAGFTSADAIKMMKGAGKKDAKLLFSLEDKFINGCKLVNKISENEAKQLFENIKHSSRYLFNKSHSVEYSIVSYWSAYTKKCKPLEFYKEWLSASDRKLDPHAEVRNLVISARSDGIEIVPPSARYMTSNFFIRDGKVHFGLTHVKGVSAYELDQLWSLMSEYGVMIHPTQLLVNVLPKINKRTCEALIRVGAFDYLGVARTKLLHYYTCVYMLTKTEIKFFEHCTEDLKDAIGVSLATKKEGGAAASVTRLEKLKNIAQMIINPGRSLDDTPIMIATTEEELIGIPLSCSYMDSCLNATNADTTCREFKRGKSGKMSLAVRVKEVKEHLMKDGESKMAFLTVEDDTAEVGDVVIFKEEYKNFGRFLYTGAFVGIIGEKGKKNSLVVSRVVEL